MGAQLWANTEELNTDFLAWPKEARGVGSRGSNELCLESLLLLQGRAQSSRTLQSHPGPWGPSSSRGLFTSSFPTEHPHHVQTLPPQCGFVASAAARFPLVPLKSKVALLPLLAAFSPLIFLTLASFLVMMAPVKGSPLLAH